MLSFVRLSASPDLGSPTEQNVFKYFEADSGSLSGVVQSSFWNHYVLQLSRSEPAVWHAAIALSCLGSDGSLGPSCDHDYALRQYGKALKLVQSLLAKPNKDSNKMVLTVCLLFVTIGLRLRDDTQVESHLSGGLKVVQEHFKSAGAAGADSADGLTIALIEAFERLDVQRSVGSLARVQLNQGLSSDQDDGLVTEQVFRSLAAASRSIQLHMAAMRELWYTSHMNLRSPQGQTDRDWNHLQEIQSHQLERLMLWEPAMQRLALGLTNVREQQAARLLQIHYMTCRIMLSTVFSKGRETIFDKYTDEFEELLDELTTFMSIADSAQQSGEKHIPSFSIDMGIIPPLYWIAIRCRDPSIRHRALALLHRCKHREGAWVGPHTAVAAQATVALEQAGLDVRGASDIPEARRLHNAFYKVDGYGQLTVTYQQRCFEENGRWVNPFNQMRTLHWIGKAPML